MSERFDEWESCLSWVPVTEYGDPDGGFGYLFEGQGAETVHRPALAVDVSEWDDPDYQFLAFVGRDRPFLVRDCGGEPGEGVDKVRVAAGKHASRRAKSSLRDRVVDVRQELDSLGEEIEDLGEPVQEFDTFDQCMHVIGVTEYGSRSADTGYLYGANRSPRPAFAMDLRGFDPPEYQLLAFPGEEPPSIECNEDAGGLFTN